MSSSEIIRPDNIQQNIPFILNKDTENYELVRKFLEKCFISSFNDLCNTKYDNEAMIIDKEGILNSIKRKSFDNIFFIVDENNNVLAFADIEISNNIIKIDNLCNNIKYGKGYGKIILTYIFNNFNDDLVNSKKIIRLSPVYEVIPYYLKFKYPNFPILPPLDDKYDNDNSFNIIHNSTDEGEILYGNSDIINKYLLENNYNDFLQLLDDTNISYDKDELDSKDIKWYKDVMTKRINKNKELDKGDRQVVLNYINQILKYTPISLPKIDNYIPIKAIQRGGFKKNIKLNFVINNKKKVKKNYIFLSKIKRKEYFMNKKNNTIIIK